MELLDHRGGQQRCVYDAGSENVMMWQNYALANSNAMDGLNETSQIKDVRTWYDNALTATSAVLALLTLAAAAMYIRDAKRRKNS